MGEKPRYYLFVCRECKTGECHTIFYTPRTAESKNHRLGNCTNPNHKWVPVAGSKKEADHDG